MASRLPRSIAVVHEHTPPNEDDPLVKAIVELLGRNKGIDATSTGVAHLLQPFGIKKPAVLAALGLAGQGTGHRPNARLKRSGVEGATTTDVVHAAKAEEQTLRALYVIRAAKRLNDELKTGVPMAKAVHHERVFTRAHEQARRNRLNIAARIQRQARLFGPLLGWYRDPTSNSEAECYEADGHNFYAALGTVIGYPGAVHPHCHCVAGPPHVDGGLVNDYIMPRLKPIPLRTYKLKK